MDQMLGERKREVKIGYKEIKRDKEFVFYSKHVGH